MTHQTKEQLAEEHAEEKFQGFNPKRSDIQTAKQYLKEGFCAGFERGQAERDGEIAELKAKAARMVEHAGSIKADAVLAERERDGLRTQLAAKDAEIARLREGLEFYANGDHFEYCGDDEFEPESVSGEPTNWLCGGVDAGSFQYENGAIAREALASVAPKETGKDAANGEERE